MRRIAAFLLAFLVLAPDLGLAAGAGRMRLGRSQSAVYPPGVIAAGLQSVWDLRSTAGPTLATNKIMNADQASLPATSNVTASPPQVFLPTTGTPTLDRWDWNNYNPVVRGGANLNTFTNNKFRAPGFGRLLKVGNDGPAGTALVQFTDFDATGISNVNAGATQIDSNSTLTVQNSRMFGASHINLKAFGVAVVQDSFLGTFCLNPPVAAHCESAFFSNNTTLSRVLVDNSAAAPSGGQTGPLYFEADAVGNIVATMDQTIINWPDAMALLGTLQVAGKNGKSLRLTVSNSVFKKGSNAGLAGYFVITQFNTGTVCIIDGGGNYDLVSGNSINLTFGSC